MLHSRENATCLFPVPCILKSNVFYSASPCGLSSSHCATLLFILDPNQAELCALLPVFEYVLPLTLFPTLFSPASHLLHFRSLGSFLIPPNGIPWCISIPPIGCITVCGDCLLVLLPRTKSSFLFTRSQGHHFLGALLTARILEVGTS